MCILFFTWSCTDAKVSDPRPLADGSFSRGRVARCAAPAVGAPRETPRWASSLLVEVCLAAVEGRALMCVCVCVPFAGCVIVS